MVMMMLIMVLLGVACVSAYATAWLSAYKTCCNVAAMKQQDVTYHNVPSVWSRAHRQDVSTSAMHPALQLIYCSWQ